MPKSKFNIFRKGDVIRTNPEDGFYGIAVVLDDGKRLELSPGRLSYPMCHIAVTPLIYDFEVTMNDIDLSQIYPLRYLCCYQLKNKPEFFKEELLVHIYTTRNVPNLPVIGSLDPLNVYQGELSWRPMSDRFYYYGDPRNYLGREAYLCWLDKSKIVN